MTGLSVVRQTPASRLSLRVRPRSSVFPPMMMMKDKGCVKKCNLVGGLEHFFIFPYILYYYIGNNNPN